jgi:DNA adenine methylase
MYLTPILKWPGGKRRLVQELLLHCPAERSRYFEPFFGGGALFFALGPDRAVISDANDELMDCYKQVRDNVEGVISGMQTKKRRRCC